MGSLVEPPPPDLKPLLTAAVVFWFEVFGVMGLLIYALAPMMVIHGSWPPTTWADGTVLRLVALLVGVPAYVGVALLLGPRFPTLRAVLLVVLGAAGIGAIVVAWSTDLGLALLIAIWLGFPSFTLVLEWGPPLLRQRIE